MLEWLTRRAKLDFASPYDKIKGDPQENGCTFE